MAYNQKHLDAYRQLIAEGKSFRSATCPYCNGERDPTVKHVHPSTKPDSPWGFYRDVLVRKYATVQSPAARANMEAAGEPRMLVVGPMVDQSELPFRMLCRQYGATLAYTPMLHARSFAEGAVYRSHFLTTSAPAEVQSAMAAPSSRPMSDAVRDAAASSDAAVADTSLIDRPCIVQFCGHDADTVLRAARFAVLGEQAAVGADAASSASGAAAVYPLHIRVPLPSSNSDEEGSATTTTAGATGTPATQEHLVYQCDAVDLNLGCPQGIARRGHYGSFLMEDWDLIHTIVHTLHVELEVPVTVKIRVFDHPGRVDGRAAGEDGTAAAGGACDGADAAGDTLGGPRKDDFDEALTILYARMIRDAGAQLLCIHGRTREMKGQQTGLANMDLIRRVRAALGGSIPVISNGNVRTYDDILARLRETACEGHMCAEPLLWDPTLFSNPRHPVMPGRTHGADKATRLAALHTALVYLQWVRRCPVDIGFVKAHLFKMCFHSYELHTSFREELGQLKTTAAKMKEVANGEVGAEEGVCGVLLRQAGTSTADNQKIEMPAGVPARTPCMMAEADDEEEAAAAAAAAAAASVSSSAFAQYVGAIEAHLAALIVAERDCAVEGTQPKAAQAEKAKAREKVVDVWEEEGGLGIDF